MKPTTGISTWEAFWAHVGPRPAGLLRRLSEFHQPILVSGCQRSGTTLLTDVIDESGEISKHTLPLDCSDELAGALVLAGLVDYRATGRHCFQTTYLDGAYKEYLQHLGGFKMVWVLRNPLSTVFSLTHNWPSPALETTFRDGPAQLLRGIQRLRLRLPGAWSFNQLERACLVYNWKLGQLQELAPALGRECLLVIDYDDLVSQKAAVSKAVYDFVGLKFQPAYSERVNAKSLEKAAQLKHADVNLINRICLARYSKASELVTRLTP